MLNENENQSIETPSAGEYRFIPAQEPEVISEKPAPPEPTPVEPESNETFQAYQQPQQFIPTPPPQKQKKKENRFGKSVALTLCMALIGGILGSVLYNGANDLLNLGKKSETVTLTESKHDNVVIDINTIDTTKQMTPAEVYAANVNSTVGITTSITTNFWGYQTTSAASGSGFIISEDGYVLTNYHVIEGSSAITVSFFDGNSAEATLIGYDASNDIAVLKVNAENLTPVRLGDSENMNVGDAVLAIGNPLGELTFTLTTGVVSALEREVTTSAGTTMTLIQTDCAINSGNSGGALFNLYGEVVGITNAKYSSSANSEASIDNIGFAIPLNHVRKIVESIIEKGYYTKPYIGVTVTDVSAETQSYGLPKGAAVKSVTEGAPAHKAGLQVNDIITKIDGQEILGSNDLVRYISQCDIGQTLKLTVYRMGAYIELEMTVGEQKQAAPQQQQQQPSSNPNGFFNPFG